MAMRKRGGEGVRLWGWTDHKGDIVAASTDRYACSDNWYGGRRIRVVVTPAKKPAKKGRKK